MRACVWVRLVSFFANRLRATQSGVIGELASLTIQAAAIVSLLISSYTVIFFCPTSIAINSKLRQDCMPVTTFLL